MGKRIRIFIGHAVSLYEEWCRNAPTREYENHAWVDGKKVFYYWTFQGLRTEKHFSGVITIAGMKYHIFGGIEDMSFREKPGKLHGESDAEHQAAIARIQSRLVVQSQALAQSR